MIKLEKKIYDSVHRFIHLSALEHALIRTKPFQRLHYIHQLGVTFFVYPGTVHRRFEHSLGAMELASRMYEMLVEQKRERLLDVKMASRLREVVPEPGSKEALYWKCILRFGALCHDLGHLPFSHVAEKRLLKEGGHEKWTARIIASPYLRPIWDEVNKKASSLGIDRDSVKDVIKIAIGEERFLALYPDEDPLTPWENIVSEILTGDFFGADRIDYLLRDAQCSGLAYGSFDYHQLFEVLHILPKDEKSDQLTLGIEESGMASCEALLLARHYMYKRLYQYPTVKAYSFHLARFMETIYYDLEEDLERYVAMTDNEVLAELNVASKTPSHPGHFDATCVYLRASRFSALPLKNRLKEEDLTMLRNALNLPSDQMEWEISAKKGKKGGGFFPILKEDGSLCQGNEISEISIPSHQIHWIFIHSAYRDVLKSHLKPLDSIKT